MKDLNDVYIVFIKAFLNDEYLNELTKLEVFEIINHWTPKIDHPSPAWVAYHSTGKAEMEHDSKWYEIRISKHQDLLIGY
jgi:hypothetical protein